MRDGTTVVALAADPDPRRDPHDDGASAASHHDDAVPTRDRGSAAAGKHVAVHLMPLRQWGGGSINIASSTPPPFWAIGRRWSAVSKPVRGATFEAPPSSASHRRGLGTAVWRA